MGRRASKLLSYIKSEGFLATAKKASMQFSKGINNIFYCIEEFGFSYFIKRTYYFRTKRYDKYNKMNYDILMNESLDFIDKFNKLPDYMTVEPEKRNVWVCWWQGYGNMPEVVKMCYNHLINVLDQNRFEITLISEDNFRDYVDIPPLIIKKLQQGKITLTFFSDILRQGLLFQNGGVWIDSTIWLEKGANKFLLFDNDFFSIKLKSIDDQTVWGQLISECKWCSFLLGAKKGNKICGFVFESMCNYTANHNFFVDYFIQNQYIKIAYNNILKAKNDIDEIECSNPNLYELFRKLSASYSDELFKCITNETSIFKLTYKANLTEYTPDGQVTVYGYLKQKALNDVTNQV